MAFWQSVKNFLNPNSDNLDQENVEAVENIIGYHFHDQGLLRLALTHRSYDRPNNNHNKSNERLEFLGDSVLGLVIADRLFEDNRGAREGFLTKTKAMLVNEITLAKVGKEIKLNDYLRLSPEEDKLGGRQRPSIISDAFESVIGAVYLDGGIDAARDIILRLIYMKKNEIVTDEAQKNFKGELLEMLQAKGKGMPRYEVVSEAGPDHEKEFSIVVHCNGKKIGNGIGHTKKEAEQKAAAIAIDTLRNN